MIIGTGVNAPYGVREGVPELIYVYVYIRVPLQVRVIAFHPNPIANDGVRHDERVWNDCNGKPTTPLTDACTVLYTHLLPKSTLQYSSSAVDRRGATPRVSSRERAWVSYCSRRRSFRGTSHRSVDTDALSGRMGVTHRYHIGESLIPSVRHYLRFVCAEENVEGYGFMHKVRPRASVCVVGLMCGCASQAQRSS